MESQATERMVQPLEIDFFVMAVRSARGHGLGLQAESPGAGQGSTFAVESPCSPVKDAPASGRTYSQTDRSVGLEEAPDLTGIRVLIVEDEEHARARVTKVHEGQGARFQLHLPVPVPPAEPITVVASLATRRN